MGPLHEYEVNLNGSPTTALLSERDAARLGARPIQPVPGPAELEADEAPEEKAAQQPANKARGAKDKGA